jgi:Holliday junction DNA helicase RuvA
MISVLKGTLIKKEIESVVIDVGGVGYEVQIPLSTYAKLPSTGENVTLEIKMHVSDSSIELYGFFTTLEKDIYSALIQVPGIGPKLARAILSGIEPRELKIAIVKNDILRLKSIPRVGQKLAEKIVLELKGKLTGLLEEEEKTEIEKDSEIKETLLKALQGLGYKRNEVYDIVTDVLNNREDIKDLGVLLKETLRRIQR